MTQTPNTPTAQKPQTFGGILASAKFGEVLPTFMKDKAKDFVRLAMIDIPRNRDLARIAQAWPQKVVGALMDCARLGLMPGPLGHMYLVPFGDEVQPIAGYKGLVALARRSGEVKRIDVDVIYKGDEYVYIKGDAPKFEHVPNLAGARTNADIIAAYAFAYDKDGHNIGGTVMTRADVDAIRARSKTGRSGPWQTDYAEMAKKTAIRRASKLWPVSTEFAEAAAMGGDDDEPSGVPGTVANPSMGNLENQAKTIDDSLYAEDGAETKGDEDAAG